MIKTTIHLDVRRKKVLIMGLGLHGGGVGTARFFTKLGALVTITDLRAQGELKESIAKLKEHKGIRYALGGHRKQDFLRADIIIKNPGVAPASPYLALARGKGIPITTDVGIFLRQCPATIIGVTGTRGKSTASFLIFKFLETFFKMHRGKKRPRVFLGGNIRASVLDFMDMVTRYDVVVLELSSFQLDDLARDSWDHTSAIKRRSPHIAVLTNILRDHLNRHGNMQSYIAAKTVIFKYQTPHDILFANGFDPMVKKIITKAPGQIKCPRLAKKFVSLVDAHLGSHYRSSVALAIGVGTHLNVPETVITSVLRGFRGLPGRQEMIGRMKGAFFINDTTATIPDASMAAIKRFRLLAGTSCLMLIAGGSDKQLQFSEMAHMISASVDHLILLPGTATNQLLGEMKKNSKKPRSLQKAESMRQAVNMAYALAKKGDYIVLSPGAASFGLFTNEFDRGDKFIAAVKSLM